MWGHDGAQITSLAGGFPPSRGGSRTGESHAIPTTLPVLCCVLGAIGALRLWALAYNGTDLFTDEAQYWVWSRELAWGYYSKPPLIAWLIAAVTPLCGDGEFCVRLPATLIHLATSLVIYGIGLRLFSQSVGFWSAVAFATLPGISLSSGIISTDVPLLLAWAIALFAFVELTRDTEKTKGKLGMALLLGAALGIGLNAKYAMAYFVPCAGLYFLISPERRSLLARPHLGTALGLAAVLIAPNLAWNIEHAFATFAHTADNANWAGSLFNPRKALEFLASQFGVFGPIMFGALLIVVWRSIARRGQPPLALSEEERLLLAFSLPILLAVTVQAFLSRSLANWAAPAYVAATILVVAILVRQSEWHWLRRSLVVNGTLAIAIAIASAQAGRFAVAGHDPFSRTLGNRELAELIRSGHEGNSAREVAFGAILTDDRDIAAALLYYGRDLPLPLYMWRHHGRPRNHFELTRPFDPATPGPVLLVTRRADGSGIPAHFRSSLPLGPLHVSAGEFSERFVHVFELDGPKAR